MKIYIAINKPAINGYVNLDLAGGENKYVGRITNIDDLACDAECVEILADDVLDYIRSSEILPTLRHYISKLRHGGKLIIGGTDLQSLCKLIVTKQLNCVEANEILHGNQESVFDFRYGQINMNDLVGLLRNEGLKIMKKRLYGYKFVVEGVRQ